MVNHASSDLANVMINGCRKTSYKDFTGVTSFSVHGESINNQLDRAISPTTLNTNSTSELLATSVNHAPTPKALPKSSIQTEDHNKVSSKPIYQKSSSIHQCDCICKFLAVEPGRG